MLDPYEIRQRVQTRELTRAEALPLLLSWLGQETIEDVTLRVQGRPLVDIVVPGQVVPHTRVGRERGTDRAKRYHSYKQTAEEAAALLIRQQGAEIPQDKDLPWYLFTTHYRYWRRGDADNLHKALADVLEGQLYQNDRQVRAGGYEVLPCDKGEDATEVVAGIIEDYPR